VGEVLVEPERLTGDAVNIAARIESFAAPGGVMLSDSAYDQVKNRSDVGVVPLGRFRLKNVGRPFELYAVSADGVVVPDPATLEGKGDRFASLPSNLPKPAAPLVGRAADLASLVELVREHRVVTITGPGGVGKTRIVVELGRLLAPEFLDGVSFVELADVMAVADFLPAVAEALDVKEAEGRSFGEGVAVLLGEKTALLLLDNFERVVSAAPDVAGLIGSCRALRIVITSRTLLRIAAERQYPLAPLALPPSSNADSAASLLAYPAIALFVERARSTRGSFEQGAPRTARSRPRRAHLRPPRRFRAASGAARDDRVEPLAPRGAGAAPFPAHGRFRRRVHRLRSGGRLRRRRRERARRARVARRQGARPDGRPG
jgi:hypothetical protein